MRLLFWLFAVLLAGAVLTPGAARAQCFDGESTYDCTPNVPVDPGGPIFIPPGGAPVPPAGGSAGVGPMVYQQVTDASAFCAALPDSAYQIDCLAERLGQIAAQMPSKGPYAETKAALTQASARLRAVQTKYADTGRKGGKSFSSPSNGQRTSRPIRPVDPGRQSLAVAEAKSVIEETQTVLLRSSESQTTERPAIQNIAAAVGSNKILLRST